MATIYLYPLFVLLIVLSLRLDSIEAAEAEDFPPEGFRSFCFIVVEAGPPNGIYRYDLNEEVIMGYPTMVKLDIRVGLYHVDSRTVDTSYYLSYTERDGQYALRLSVGNLRFDFNTIHTCNEDTGTTHYWRIVEDSEAAPLKGYAQLFNFINYYQYADPWISNIWCVASSGQIRGLIKYDVPVYYEMHTAFTCVTWMVDVAKSSGVKSRATAAQVDPHTRQCTLFYEHHKNFTIENGDSNYCLLGMPETIGDFPGFYPGCQIYVDDPIFAGQWDLYFLHHYDWMPYMVKRNADYGYISNPAKILDDSYTDYYFARLDADDHKLQFVKNDVILLEFAMVAHFCIGPNTGQEVRTETAAGVVSVAYRNDAGMKCVPFYINVNFYKTEYDEDNALQPTRATLDGDPVDLSMSLCNDYLTTEYPEKEWKVIKSILNANVCLGFERGIDYDFWSFYETANTYSCIFI